MDEEIRFIILRQSLQFKYSRVGGCLLNIFLDRQNNTLDCSIFA